MPGVDEHDLGHSPTEADLDTGVFGGIWRRSTLERYGGWDEAWTVNRDAELAARMLADGGRIVCLSELGAEYVPRNSLRSLGRQYWRYGFFRAKTARRHPGSLRRSHVLPPALALSVLLTPGGSAPARAARAGICVYGAMVLAAAITSEREGPSDLIGIPAVFATMHLSWGFGFLAGCARFGLPWRALRGELTK